MATLSDAQLLMLDTLIYSGKCENNMDVRTILNNIENSGYNVKGASMTPGEWKDLVMQIRNEPNLLNYNLTNYPGGDPNTRMGCFVDDPKNPTDVNVIFQGTGSDYEWRDNGQGGYLTSTHQQEAAAAYINDLPPEYGNNITVSGHSKGGNKAQYVTIVTDRVDRCVAYDGQGFSSEFIENEEYRQKIEERKMAITNYSAEYDPVNALLHPIAGRQIYLQTEEQEGPFDYHKPNILLDGAGNLRPVGEPSWVTILVNEYSTYLIDNLDEPERSILLNNMMECVILAIGDKKEMKNVVPALFGASSLIGHVDDFVLHKIGERYGYLGEYGMTLVLTAIYPKLFLDDFLHINAEGLNMLVDKIVDGAKAIYNKLKEFGEKAAEYGKKFVAAVQDFVNKARNWVNNNLNRGYQYAVANPYLKVNTATLRNYASRLQTVNRRLVTLDQQMDRLYTQVGLLDLLKLIQADLLTGYSWRVLRCAGYLTTTALDFESTERNIADAL